MKKNCIVDIRKQKTIKNCQKCNPPLHTLHAKIEIFEKLGKGSGTIKNEKKRIVDIRKQKKN